MAACGKANPPSGTQHVQCIGTVGVSTEHSIKEELYTYTKEQLQKRLDEFQKRGKGKRYKVRTKKSALVSKLVPLIAKHRLGDKLASLKEELQKESLVELRDRLDKFPKRRGNGERYKVGDLKSTLIHKLLRLMRSEHLPKHDPPEPRGDAAEERPTKYQKTISSAQPDPAKVASFAAGDTVKAHSLTVGVKFNDQQGKVKGYKKDNGRVLVEFANHDEPVALKPTNLLKLQASEEEQPKQQDATQVAGVEVLEVVRSKLPSPQLAYTAALEHARYRREKARQSYDKACEEFSAADASVLHLESECKELEVQLVVIDDEED